jgi:hypothetical protein
MPTERKSPVIAMAVACCLSLPGLAAQPDSGQGQGTAAPQATPSPSGGAKAFDAMVVRPVTFLTSLFSAGVFVASLPLIPLDSGTDVSTARKALVDYPFTDTFTRPLGDFGDMPTPAGQSSMNP